MIFFFESPFYHAFLLVENFFNEGKSVFTVFPNMDDKMNNFVNMSWDMLEKNKKQGIKINFLQLQEYYSQNVSNSFYVLLSLIYFECDGNYTNFKPHLK